MIFAHTFGGQKYSKAFWLCKAILRKRQAQTGA